MSQMAAPFFVRPHRFDQPEPDSLAQPELDRHHHIVLEPGERALWRGRVEVSGYLLTAASDHASRHWSLLLPAEVTVTDRRVAYVCENRGFEEVGCGGGAAIGRARHRRHPIRLGNQVVSGQVRWQWPARLHLLPAVAERSERVLIVCESLRTTDRPGLALGDGDLAAKGAARELLHLVRRTIARFRLDNPGTPQMPPTHRDALTVRAGAGLWADELADPQRGIDLPASLVVEFSHRDDYQRRTTRGFSLSRWAMQVGSGNLRRSGQPGSA